MHKLEFLEQQLEKYSESEEVKWLTRSVPSPCTVDGPTLTTKQNSRLNDTETALQALTQTNGLDYANVTASISQCEKDISFFLNQFSVSSSSVPG